MRQATLLLSCVLAVMAMASEKTKTTDGTGNLSKARREELGRKIGEIKAFLAKSGDTNAVRTFKMQTVQDVCMGR